MHKGTCGRPLPTLQLVREASVEAACGILEEYGGGHAELAIACVRRSFELLHNKRQAHVLEERLSAFMSTEQAIRCSKIRYFSAKFIQL